MQLKARDIEVMTWLIHMKFMTLDQIGKTFFEGCNLKRAPYRRILKLMKEGYIAKKKVYIEPKDVYIPTKKAVGILKQAGNPFAMNLSKDKNFPNYDHDKTITDIRILFKKLGIETWVAERVIRSFKPRGASPDAVLITKDYSYAIEYERTEKKIARYEEILSRYRSREPYDYVLYICMSDGFIKRIKEKYYPSPKFYFICVNELLDKGEDATFFSCSDGLPVKQLMQESTEMNLERLDPSFVEFCVKIKAPDDSWKKRKPYIPIPRARPREDEHDDYGAHDSSENEDGLDANVSSVYEPGGGNHDGDD